MPKPVVREYCLGIDPGASGGIALLSKCGTVRRVRPIPDDDLMLWCHLLDCVHDLKISLIVVEQVGGYMPGSRGNIGSAMFNFGWGAGTINGMLVALQQLHGAKTWYRQPHLWQKGLGISPRKKAGKGQKAESKDEFKRRLYRKAQELFQTTPMTKETCDALLIAEYGRRCWNEGAVPCL